MDTRVKTSGGEGGIRTLGTGVSPYNGLANRRIRPLCHLSGVRKFSLPRHGLRTVPLITDAVSRLEPVVARTVKRAGGNGPFQGRIGSGSLLLLLDALFSP
jgi:hypothetical protein